MIVVKHKYISAKEKLPRAKGSWKRAKGLAIQHALAHIKYIQHRPGPDNPKGGRQFFDGKSDQTSILEFKQELKDMDTRGAVIHKLVLAPDVAPGDPKDFTRSVIHQLELEKGLDLHWVATVHRNTDNVHIHVAILGKDMNGRQVLLKKEDHLRARVLGGEYLDRDQPRARLRAHLERELRQKKTERSKLSLEECEARLESGEDLDWRKEMILREFHEPYEQWKKENLRSLNDKRSHFWYLNDEIRQDDSFKKLRKVAAQAAKNQNDNQLRMSERDKRLLQFWIEDKDRSRFSGALEKEISTQVYKHDKNEGKLESSQVEPPLPWLRKKIIREQLEPYNEWKRNKLEHQDALAEKLIGAERNKDGSPSLTDKSIETINVQNQEFSRESSLVELSALEQYLWQNPEDRISTRQFAVLRSWIEEKEGREFKVLPSVGEGDVQAQPEENPRPNIKLDRDEITYLDKTYAKNELKLEDLFELSKLAQGNRYSPTNSMSKEDHLLLCYWMEEKDRERFSGILERQMDTQVNRQNKREQTDNRPGHWVDPDAEKLCGPVVGVILGIGGFAKSVVDDIPTDWDAHDILEARYREVSGKLEDLKQYARENQVDPATEQAIKNLQELKAKAARDILHRMEDQFDNALRQKELKRERLKNDWDDY